MIVIGLGTILTCGNVFAMNYSSILNDPKTEISKSQESADCVFKADRENPYNGKDEIQITNNCSDDIVVTYEYWSDNQNKYITAKYRVKAKTTSAWLPAESYKNYTWDWA